MEGNSDEKFAIIGIGCRLPPAATSLSNFWRFLIRGGNALKPVPKNRWDWRQYFDEDKKRPGKSYAPKAAFLDADIRQFDPMVFGISPREAASIDPQQRLLLESTWEAFEDAGIPVEKIYGSSTGVFVGGFCLDHLVSHLSPSNIHLTSAHSPAGVMMTVLSNRISHVFDLRGPSLSLDTACSSSLVALHYACQSLRLRECDMVLAGGVNVMSRPEFPIVMSKGQFLSNHGECHAFDETAAGYARGEGAGIFLLKRYEDAVAAGDQIHAVICGTGVNQDGHTDGISLPNRDAQESLLHEVYRRAGVAPSEVDYVEAHGTGTQAGDPAEAAALQENFSKGRTVDHKLFVGSVKTNVGHLEAAAGVAGVMKAIGVLKFRQIPKNLHFEHPNPKIPFADYCLEVVSETKTLPSTEEKPALYVGVNSFGYGGTNAHVLLESPPAVTAAKAQNETGKNLRVIPLSAQSDEALRDLAGKVAFQIGQGLPGSFADMAYTTAFRRSHLEARLAAVAESLDDLRQKLIAVSTGQPHKEVAVGSSATHQAGPGLVFVYTGMGPQWWAMGQELIRTEPIVEQTLDEIDGHFQKLAGWSLKDAMLANEANSRMASTELAQPANFALQIALTRLLETYGVRPKAVVGHSVGEVASAYVAGIYTMEEAVRISYHRSHLQQTMAGRGSMLAVGLPEPEAEKWIRNEPTVSIAAVNSFHAVTLSGDTEPLQKLSAELEKAGIFQKFLRVEVAYHSPQMDPLREELLSALGDLSPQPAKLPLYSTAHGGILPAEKWDAEYWWHNVRQAVRFADTMRSLFADGFTSFLEVGPHPVLGNSIKECAADLERRVNVYPSLIRKEPEAMRIRLALADLYAAGHELDWSTLAPTWGSFIAGPQYPWQRKPYWLESEQSKMERLGLPGPVYLNRTITGTNPGWEVEVNRNYFPFLFDHGVQGQTVFPGMGYIEAAIALSAQIHQKPAVVLENVSIEKVLIVDYSKLQYLITELAAEDGRFTISSRVQGEEEGAERHCRGRILPQAEPRTDKLDLATLRAGCPVEVDVEDFYERMLERGLHYGPKFRPTTEVAVGANRECYFLKIDASAVAREKLHPLHPTLLDAAIQPILFCAQGETVIVPVSFEQVRYFSRPSTSVCHAFGRIVKETESTIVADVWLTDADGVVCAHAVHLLCQVIDSEPELTEGDAFWELEWKPEPLESPTNIDGKGVLILADSEEPGLARQIQQHLPRATIAEAKWTAGDGFGTDEITQALTAQNSAKKLRIVALCGSQPGSDPATSTISLNGKLASLFQAIGSGTADAADVTLVTRGAKSVLDNEAISDTAAFSTSALGLLAVNELDAVSCRSIDLEANDPAGGEKIAGELAAKSRGDIAYRGDQRFVSVLHARKEDKSTDEFETCSIEEPLELRLGTKGRIESLRYERTERVEPADGEIEVRILSSALNYKDLLKIYGRLHPVALERTFYGTDLGMECAGTVLRCGAGTDFTPGDRVVVTMPRAFRTFATIPANLAVKIPDNLGLEAAGIPAVYLAAYRGLIDIANLQPGERVLIHHGTGGLGLAAIDVARWIGAEIYATAGSEEKRKILRDMGVEHVFSSRDLDFGQRIREITNGEGIDAVISAQTGQAMHVSLGLLRTGGRYIEVGKKDIAEDNGLPMRAFNRNVIFASVDVDQLLLERAPLIRKTLAAIFERFAKGDFKLGPSRTFAAAETDDAFRMMAQSRQIGKVLLDFSQGEVRVLKKNVVPPLVASDGCYIVTGGTSGFGLVTAQWLSSHGAGRIILASRSGTKAPGIGKAIRAMEAHGTRVEALSVDITDAAQVDAMLQSARSGTHTLRGIIHAAMVLDDAMLMDLTEERFLRVMQPKVTGAVNLVTAIGDGQPLDFLVFYSSISAMVGNRGQASYVVANSFLDGYARSLRAKGLPALSINWGALSEAGVVARDERLEMALDASGIAGLSNHEALTALAQAIRLGRPQVGRFHVDWQKWHEANPRLTDDPRFREQRTALKRSGENEAAFEVRNALAEHSREQRLRALEEHLQEVLAEVLKMSKNDVSVNRQINEMGVDSLMVLELGLGIKERIGVSFSAMEFLKGPSLQQLATMAESKLWCN